MNMANMDIANMDMANIDENALFTCGICHIVLKYYDYLSHSETCIIPNMDNNSMDTYDNTYENTYANTYANTYEGTYYDYVPNNSSNNVNLYNSMFNNGLNNNLFNDSQENDNIVDIGLGIENLSLYSEKVPITENSDCVICMNTYQQGKIFYLMKCMHSFCDDCSKRWFDFKSVCPLCKTNMKKI